ncbi:MAG: OmpA family protein [Flavobacteriales bacterium]|nr:OmpA family protein [Flavobacteriales bacterium]
MLQKIALFTVLATLSSSCVSKKIYDELNAEKNKYHADNIKKTSQLEQLTKDNAQLSQDLNDSELMVAQLKLANEQLAMDIAGLKRSLNLLQESYDALEKNSTAATQANYKKNRELLTSLEKKESELAEERARLDQSTKELEERSQRINELEAVIAAKQKKMQDLKEALSKALYSFENKGLTVETKNGKVYVSMENKLLFKSGSWSIGTEGKKAITEIGLILAQQPEISLIIEGHTDNEPYPSQGNLVDNWDLSTKRATEIVRIFEKINGIDLQNITAAGRGKYAPIGENETVEGRAKNRRIEFILAPKLDEISEMLNQENN